MSDAFKYDACGRLVVINNYNHRHFPFFVGLTLTKCCIASEAERPQETTPELCSVCIKIIANAVTEAVEKIEKESVC